MPKRTTALDLLIEGTPFAEPGDGPKFDSLTASVEASIAAAPWLTDADAGLITLARVLAAQIDGLVLNRTVQQTDPLAITRELRLTAPALLSALDALGASPAARATMVAKVDGEREKSGGVDPVSDKLADFQRRADEAVRAGGRARS